MNTSLRLITRMKNYNNQRVVYLRQRHSYIRALYIYARREHRNTTYFKYIYNLYKYNLRQYVRFPIKSGYINYLYTLCKFSTDAKAKAKAEATTKNEDKNVSQKAALLVGINYVGTNSELRGCENDVFNSKKILIEKYGFKEKDIVVLVQSGNEQPTRANILKYLDKLVEKSNKGCSSLWFHYAGHGIYINDKNKDEKDFKDECIVSSDERLITDDEFRQRFTTRINKNTKLFCLMDCCHSGTIMDLRYKYRSANTKSVIQNNINTNANIIALSGCRDDQTSADAWMKGNWVGALTTCFLDTLKDTNYKPSLLNMVEKTRELLRKNRFTQIPQLTASREINPSTIFSV